MRLHRATLAGILTLLFSACALAASDEAAPTAPPASPAASAPPGAEPAKPEALLLSKLAEQAQATSRLVEHTTLLAQPTPEVEALKQELGTIRDNLQKLEEQTKQQLEGQSGVEQMRATQTQWLYLREQLVAKLQLVQARAAELESALGELGQQEEQWGQIKSQVSTAAVPAEAKKHYANAMADIEQGRKALTTALKAVLSHADQWQSLVNKADDALLTLKQYETSQRAELLSSMQSPLWALSAEDFEPNDGTWQSVRQQGELVAYYLSQQLRPNAGLGATTLAILLFLWRLRARPDTFAPLREGASLRFALLDRPYSTAVACAAALGLLLYQHPPLLLSSALALMLFIPVVRLGLPQVPDRIRPLAWLISVLFAVNSLGVLTESIPAIQRLWVVGSAAVSAIVCMHALRQLSRAEDHHSSAWKTLRTILWLGLIAASVATIGGIVGAAALSEFLLSGLTSSAYAGLCIAVVTGIVSDFVGALLYLPVAARSNMVRHNRTDLARKIGWAARAFGILAWLSFTLDQFLIRDDVWAVISALLSSSLKVGNISVSLGDALAIVLTMWLSFKLSRFLQFVFKEDIAPRANLGRGVPDAVSTLMHYAIVVLGFIVAIGAAGIDLSKIAILAGALGVGIGIGLQDVVNNFTSGLILLFEHHIKPGDIIQCGTLSGRVMHIGLRSSIVRTFDGAEVIVPNGQLVSAQVINWTHSDQQRRITIPIGVAYGSSPDQVIAALLEVANADMDILSEPEPNAFFLRFSASSMDFELRAWVSTGEILNDVTSRLCVHIINAFKEKGIEIPMPQHDVHLRSVPPDLLQQLNRSGV